MSYRRYSKCCGTVTKIDALRYKEQDTLPSAFRLAAVACSAWNYNNGSQDYALEAMQNAESL